MSPKTYFFTYEGYREKIYLEKFKFGPYFQLSVEGQQSTPLLSPVTMYPRGREALFTSLHRYLSSLYEKNTTMIGAYLLIGVELVASGKVGEKILFKLGGTAVTDLYEPKFNRPYVIDFSVYRVVSWD